MPESNKHPEREVHRHDALTSPESIVDALGDPLIILSPELRVRFANRAFYQTFSLSKGEAVGAFIYQLGEGQWNVPQLRSVLEGVLSQAALSAEEKGERASAEVGEKSVLFTARKLGCEDGGTDRILLSIEDITERKRTEKALAESEKQLKLIMDAAPAMIGYLGSDLRFKLVNSTYERWFGIAPACLIGKQLADLFGSAFVAKIRPYVQRVMAGEAVAFEEDYPGLDGGRTLQVTYTPDLDEHGKVQGFVVLGSDVSSRKKAELAVRRSEERWRALFEGMAEGFFVGEILYSEAGVANNFRFVEVNPAFETLTGLSQATGKTALEMIPEFPMESIGRYAHVVRMGEPAHFEVCVPGLKNSWYEVRARLTEADCFAALFLNITERKAQEALLKESEQRQAALVTLGDRLRDSKNIPSLSVTATEIAGTFLRVARAGYGTVDASQTSVTIENDWTNGQVSSLVGTYRFSDFGEDLEASLRRGEALVVPDVATHPITARDSARWSALNIRAVINVPLIENGRLVAVFFVQNATPRNWTESELGFIQKVTDRTWAAAERARALRELQESEDFTRSVLASSPDCVAVTDLEGRLLTLNESGCRSMEIGDLSGRIGRPWVGLWGSSELGESVLQLAKNGETYQFERASSTATGAQKWWEVVVTPICDSTGVPVRILSVSREITERKRAEQERERLTLELKRSNEDLSQFAHTVAHDLQSPIRGVTGFAQLLKRSAGGSLSTKDLEFLDHIVASARRMADLVGGLLQFAQVGQGEIAQKPVAMDLILDEAQESLQLQIEEQGATVTRGVLPPVVGDTVQLVQLLQNLIGNALKYRRPAVPAVISVSSKSQAGYHVFSIQDNGEGIAPEHLKKIFEPLLRLHGADIPGTGLGLAMCQRIVTRHGGKIWVESEPGAGSTFFFTLPVHSSNE